VAEIDGILPETEDAEDMQVAEAAAVMAVSAKALAPTPSIRRERSVTAEIPSKYRSTEVGS